MGEWIVGKKTRAFDDTLEHHGVLGMKWGVRHDYKPSNKTGKTSKKPEQPANSNAPFGLENRKKKVTEGNGKGADKRGASLAVSSPRKKNVTYSNGKGAHKRGEGFWLKKPLGDNYSESVAGGGIPSPNELVELHNKTIDDVRKTTEYDMIFRLAKELKQLAENRKKNWNQGSTATTMVFEAKADEIVKKINSYLTKIDTSFAEQTSMIKNFKKDFSPSKWVLDDLSTQKAYSGALGYNKSTGRVSKGWVSSSPVPKNAKGVNINDLRKANKK